MVKDKLKAFLVTILVAYFYGVSSQGTCWQGNLVEVYRLTVRDVNNHILTATDMSNYGEPKIKANSENADKYTEILKYTKSLQVIPKDIQKFEETTASNKNAPSLRIELVDFAPTCPIQKVDIKITIFDTNNNDPLFTDENGYPKNIFEVEVPMPLPQNIELQNFGAKIYAKDVDLTNTKVTFSIEPEDSGPNDLDIKYGNVVDDLNKVHSAILKSTATLNYKERKYLLIVEDENTDYKRTSIGELIVRRQDDECFIMPRFESSSYIAKFDDDLLVSLLVTVLNGDGKFLVIVEDNMTEYFQVIWGPTEEDFIVKSSKKWDKEEDAIFTLRINNANLPFHVETVVIVRREQVSQLEAPRFEKLRYRGTYKDGQLSIPIIRLLGDGKGNVRFKDAEVVHIFSVVNVNGLVKIKKNGQLQPDVKEIHLTVIAERNGLEGSTEVYIKIIEEGSSYEEENKNVFIFVGNSFVIENLHVEL